MKKKKIFSVTSIIFLVVALLFLALGLGSLGSVQGTGKAYELRYRRSTDAKEPSVFFKLTNPSYVDKDGKTVTEFYRLTNVYLNVAAIYNDESSTADISLGRGASTGASAATYPATLANVKYVPQAPEEGKDDKKVVIENAVGNWIEPFDLSVTTQLAYFNVASYSYYKITANTCNVLINEIVFYGEKLTAAAGEGTGEFGVIPAEIYSASPMNEGSGEAETNEQAKVRAGALLDAQTAPVMAQSSFFRFGKEEIYSMMTVAEMRVGDVVYRAGDTDKPNIYHGDTVYNSLGTSILAFGTVIFGNSPFGLRFFPMLASFGVLVMGYLFVKELCKSEKAGLVFAVLYALSNFTFGLGHLGTPLMIGVFFFVTAFYFMYSFYNKGIRKIGVKGVLPLILSGVFGAAAICVNGVYAVASLALVGLFAAGMVRQNKARRIVLDEAIALAEAENANAAEGTVAEGAGEPAEPSEGMKRVGAVVSEYRWKNTAAPAAFFTAIVTGALLLSLLFLLPGYGAYVKLFDNPISPRLNVFQIMAKLFAGGFTAANGAGCAYIPFYQLFAGTGSLYAVTLAVINPVALLAGLLGVAYAVYNVVLVLTKKLEGKDARIALRRAAIPFGLVVIGAICGAFGGGALAFIMLVYFGLFALASECVTALTQKEGKLQKTAKILTWVGLGLLCAVFFVFAVFTFSIPLPAAFMSSLF